MTKKLLEFADPKYVQKLLQFFPGGIVAVDFETTGLSPITDKIIEVAAVKMNNKGEISTYEQLINPEVHIPDHTVAIHHITNEMVQSSPKMAEVAPEFFAFIKGYPLVAHNAQFDIGFMVTLMKSFQEHMGYIPVYDSCRLGRRVLEKLPNYKLSTLTEYFQVTLQNHHRALDDAWGCLEVFTRCLDFVQTDKSLKQYAHLMALDEYRRMSEFSVPEHLRPIIEYLPQQNIIEIQYDGGSIPEGFRPIRPVGFLPMPKGLTLHAKCLLTLQFKSFYTKKIRALQSLPAEKIVEWESFEKQQQEQRDKEKKDAKNLQGGMRENIRHGRKKRSSYGP